MLILRTREQLKQFIINYLNDDLEGWSIQQPLMIIGTEEDEKVTIIEEIAKISPVNILVLIPHRSHRFFLSSEPSNECAILIPSDQADDDEMISYHLNAHQVFFEKDSS